MEAMRIPIEDPMEEEDESWKEICNERLEGLKTRPLPFSKDGDAGAMRPSQLIEQEFLIEKTYMNSEVYKAVQEGDPIKFVDVLEQVSEREKLLLSEIFDQITHGGDSLLHVAAKFGREKIAELLLSEIFSSHRPSLLTGINIKGNTALHAAARQKGRNGSYPGGSGVIKVILSQYDTEKLKSGNTSYELTRVKNSVGNTALHEAVASSYLDAVILLFEKDDVVTHYLNNAERSPLCMAVQDYLRPSNYPDDAKKIVDCLLEVSLLKDKPRSEWWRQGQSPLHAVVRAESYLHKKKEEQWLPTQLFVQIIVGVLPTYWRATAETTSPSNALLEEIIQKRPEAIYLKDEYGGTPLHFAALYGYLDGVRIMLKRYAPAALESDANGNLPIHLACKFGKIGVVKELLQQECPYVLLNQKGQNILHVAAMDGKHDVVKYILTHDIDIDFNENDKDGNTPLHAASKSMYPMVLFYLTRDQRIHLNARNKNGLTARDIVLQQSHRPKTYRELLCHAILSSANAYCTKKGYKELQPHHDIDRMKDLVNTLMLVAILIATVTFAAGFTVPGSVYGSDAPSRQQRGTAVLAKRIIFQIFMVCNTIAMYSSTVGSFLLLWAQLGDYHLARNSFDIAIHMVALALMTMSGAFMAAAHLIVHNVSWLAILIRAIGAISILFILGAYILLIFPLESHHPLLRPASKIFIRILIPFAGSYEIPQKKMPKTSDSQEGDMGKDKNKNKQAKQFKK